MAKSDRKVEIYKESDPARDVARQKDVSTELAYRVFKMEKRELFELIDINLGGGSFDEFDLPRIRVPSGGTKYWSIPTIDGEEPAESVEGIIIYFKDVRAWWPKAEPTASPPQCRSNDGTTGMGKRWEDDDEGPHSCDKCPYSQFGSDPKGSRGQWCKQMRALFIVRENSFLPTVIFLPPTSLKSCRQYFMRILDAGYAYTDLISALTLKEMQNDEGQKYNQVEFHKVAVLSEEKRAIIREFAKQIKPSLHKVEISSDDYIPPENS